MKEGDIISDEPWLFAPFLFCAAGWSIIGLCLAIFFGSWVGLLLTALSTVVILILVRQRDLIVYEIKGISTTLFFITVQMFPRRY